ncbi:MAG TPA: HEAT repeat domain-containing protein [Planctomycetota bacterium]|nr:HEAT repeat domain-containing protein [Planctomycetota bacterium]
MRSARPLLLIVVLACLLPAAAYDDTAETIANFKRFYAKAELPRERYEAVLVLKGMNSLDAAQALAPALEDSDFGVRRAAIEVLGGYHRDDVARWLVDDVLGDHKNSRKTLLRAAAIEALGTMQQPFAYEPCAAALSDKDMGIKLAAITSLGNLKNPAACPALSTMVSDPDGALALAALDALAAIGSAEGAQAAVVAALEHPDWRVRARAIQAVVTLRLKAGVRGLIDRVEKEDGRLRGDALVALKTCTTWNLGSDPAAWRKWWDDKESTFVMPDPAKVAAALEKAKSEGHTQMAVAKAAGDKQFLTITTASESMLFVIDVSGSMDIPFGDAERLKVTGRTYPSLQRLAIVKEELAATIADLPETTSFNIFAFATDVRPWKKDPVRANILNKDAATEWVRKLQPLGLTKGGTTFEVATGMKVEKSQDGATNTYLALMDALGENAEDYGKPRSEGFVTDKPKNTYDTVFFLTDGEPTVGKTVDMYEIRREVQRVNQYRGVQIHVIYVGEFGGEDFEKMARENHGVFVKIGG